MIMEFHYKKENNELYLQTGNITVNLSSQGILTWLKKNGLLSFEVF